MQILKAIYQQNKANYLACFLIWLIMFWFLLNMPLMTDNFVYSRFMQPSYAQFMAGAEITELSHLNFSKIWLEITELYSTWCGRFTGNLIVYTLFLLPKPLYATFVATCFVLYLLLLHYILYGSKSLENLSPAWLLFLFALTWLGLPSFGSAFFWLSVGGQWPLLFQIIFLLPFRLTLEKLEVANKENRANSANLDLAIKSTSRYLALCLGLFTLGIFTAMLDFATSAAMPVISLACLIYIFFKTKQKPPAFLICACLGISLGAFLTLATPGNTSRMLITVQNDPEVAKWINANFLEKLLLYCQKIPQMLFYQILPLALLIISLISLKRNFNLNRLPVIMISNTLASTNKDQIINQDLSKNIKSLNIAEYKYYWLTAIPLSFYFFLLPALATHGAYLFSPTTPARSFCTTSIQISLAALTCLVPILNNQYSEDAKANFLKSIRPLTWIFALVCILSLINAGYVLNKMNKELELREEIFLSKQNADAIVQPLETQGNAHIVLGYHLNDLRQNRSFWVNRSVAKYYGCKSVSVDLPVMTFQSKNLAINEIKLNDDQIQIAKEQIDQKQIQGEIKNLYLYYYGSPALLALVPTSISDQIINWLKSAKIGDFRLKLIPILLARADLSLKNNYYHGKAWNIIYRDSLWLVKPGQEQFSFEIERLEKQD